MEEKKKTQSLEKNKINRMHSTFTFTDDPVRSCPPSLSPSIGHPLVTHFFNAVCHKMKQSRLWNVIVPIFFFFYKRPKKHEQRADESLKNGNEG